MHAPRSGNRIHELPSGPSGLSALPALRELNLRRNALARLLPDALPPSLTHLSLSHNR